MAILGIHHTAIVVPDLARALDFYCGVLGFVRVQDGPIEPTDYAARVTQLDKPRAEGTIVKAGWGYLELWEFKHPVYPQEQFYWNQVNRPGIRHISLYVDNAMAVYERTRNDIHWHGVPVNHSVEGDDNEAWTAYGRDPFGNILELWQLGDSDPQPFAPANPGAPGCEAGHDADISNGILGLHHLAIVVPNLEQGLAFYRDVLGFEMTQEGPIEPSSYAEVHTQLEQPRAIGWELKTGWGYLELWEFSNPKHPTPQDPDRPCNKYGFAHFSLAVDDCWAEYERLQPHMRFHAEPVAHTVEDDNEAVTTYGRDPFGNVIELWQTGPKDPQPFAPLAG